MNSLISVIIPTFNRAHTLGSALDSVIAQTWQNWECIVVDDGSEDYTSHLMEFYFSIDKRIKYVSRPTELRKGASSSRNYGLSISKGDLIQFLDSDDIISYDKLESQLELLREDPEVSLVTSRWGRFKNFLNDAEVYKNLKSYNSFTDKYAFFEALKDSLGFFPIHSYLIRKEIIAEAGNWNEFLSMNDDAEFMVRVLLKSKKIAFSEKSIAYYRSTSTDNLSSYSNEKKIYSYLFSLRLMEVELQIRFGEKNIPFMDKAKMDFYLHIRHMPHLIRKNNFFFKKQLSFNSLSSRYLNVLKKIYSQWKNR